MSKWGAGGGGLLGLGLGGGHNARCFDRRASEVVRSAPGDDSGCRMERYPAPTIIMIADTAQKHHPSSGMRSVVGYRLPEGICWYVPSVCNSLARSSDGCVPLRTLISNLNGTGM